MFFQGERGTYLGFYALALTNGPHFGPIAGGYLALNLGWRWIFYVSLHSHSLLKTAQIFLSRFHIVHPVCFHS